MYKFPFSYVSYDCLDTVSSVEGKKHLYIPKSMYVVTGTILHFICELQSSSLHDSYQGVLERLLYDPNQ